MAVSNHLGLYLPTRDDYISVKRDLSDNYEIIDESVFSNSQAIENLQSEIGKVVDGNSCSGFTLNKGDYVIVKNSTITGITDGLYTYSSSTSKSAGNAVSAGELTAVSGGIANELNSKFTSLIVSTNGTCNSSGEATLSYPTGYTKDNCIIVSVKAYNSGHAAHIYQNQGYYMIYLADDGIHFNGGSAMNGRDCEVFLTHIS
jgi:hypothetical protein